MRNPRFLLYGIGGVYNYGCEAIVRGTEKIIRESWPDAEIKYASVRTDDDKNRLTDCDIEVIPRKRHGRYSPRNIVRKLLSFVAVKWQPNMDSLFPLNNVDAVLSIGGDIYTMSPNGGYEGSLMKFGDVAEHRGIPYILWGASVGPFSQNPPVEKKIARHLKRINLISAREQESVDYLRSIGVTHNVVFCADPAFAVAPEIKRASSCKSHDLTIGINLSPLSARHCGFSYEQAIGVQADVIEMIVKNFNAHILLIPHVVCNFASDDDLRYLRRVKETITAESWAHVTLLDHDPGFIGIKKELIKCDIVIAARMHCAINALAACVPTILVSYSQKAIRMCNYVYGQNDYVLPLQEFVPEIVLPKIKKMKSMKEQIHKRLENRIPEIQRDARVPVSDLKRILKI